MEYWNKRPETQSGLDAIAYAVMSSPAQRPARYRGDPNPFEWLESFAELESLIKEAWIVSMLHRLHLAQPRKKFSGHGRQNRCSRAACGLRKFLAARSNAAFPDCGVISEALQAVPARLRQHRRYDHGYKDVTNVDIAEASIGAILATEGFMLASFGSA